MARKGSLITTNQPSIDITHPSRDNTCGRIQQLWEAILHGKMEIGRIEASEARLRAQSVKLDEAIDKLQLEVTYTEELTKNTDMADSPTLLQAVTPLV